MLKLSRDHGTNHAYEHKTISRVQSCSDSTSLYACSFYSYSSTQPTSKPWLNFWARQRHSGSCLIQFAAKMPLLTGSTIRHKY